MGSRATAALLGSAERGIRTRPARLLDPAATRAHATPSRSARIPASWRDGHGEAGEDARTPRSALRQAAPRAPAGERRRRRAGAEERGIRKRPARGCSIAPRAYPIPATSCSSLPTERPSASTWTRREVAVSPTVSADALAFFVVLMFASPARIEDGAAKARRTRTATGTGRASESIPKINWPAFALDTIAVAYAVPR